MGVKHKTTQEVAEIGNNSERMKNYMERMMKNTKPTVLVVDDQPDEVIAASELFKSLGWNVLTASNGLEAIHLIAEDNNKIRLLFSDVMMPDGVNGISLGRTINKYLPNIKVILCSGHTLPALKKEYGDLDNFMFMHKPFRVDDLLRNLIWEK
jgi:CheY-like chemotaxis protein